MNEHEVAQLIKQVFQSPQFWTLPRSAENDEGVLLIDLQNSEQVNSEINNWGTDGGLASAIQSLPEGTIDNSVTNNITNTTVEEPRFAEGVTLDWEGRYLKSAIYSNGFRTYLTWEGNKLVSFYQTYGSRRRDFNLVWENKILQRIEIA